MRFFREPVKVKLSLETNSRKATQLKKKFAAFFGVSLRRSAKPDYYVISTQMPL